MTYVEAASPEVNRARAAMPASDSARADWDITVLTTPAEIVAIRDDWRDLSQRVGDPLTYFQDYEWCAAWCAMANGQPSDKRRYSPEILTVYRHGNLAAILPLAISRVARIANVARFLGDPYCEYGGILLDREMFTPGELPQLWHALTDRAGADLLALGNLPETSSLHDMIAPEKAIPSMAGHTSLLDLTRFEDAAAYIAGQSRNFRRNRKKRLGRLMEMGRVHMRLFDGATPQYQDMLDQARAFKVAWLREGGLREDKIAAAELGDVLGEFAGSTEHATGAITAALMLDDRPIAIEVGFCNGKHYISYLGAFDPEFSEFAPGKLQVEFLLKWAFEKGIETYDFLGQPSPYKTELSNRTLSLFSYSKALTPVGMLVGVMMSDRLRAVAKGIYNATPLFLRKQALRSIGLMR